MLVLVLNKVVSKQIRVGILYAVFDLFLHRKQTGQSLKDVICNTSYERRVFHHYDNPNGSIECGDADILIFGVKKGCL
jgi:alpha-glucuronidase